jgi:hypothetical protein
MATATKSRRPRKAKQEPEAAPNPIVARRLGFLPDVKRREAAKQFKEGTSVAKIAEAFDLSMTHAAYMVRQELVESGDVSRIKPEAAAIKAALANEKDDATDWHWLACRTGLSTSKVRNLADNGS